MTPHDDGDDLFPALVSRPCDPHPLTSRPCLVPGELPDDADPVWRFARADRELARVQAAEQARWLRLCARIRARDEAWGGATVLVSAPVRRGWRERCTRALDTWRRARMPFANARELATCARAPIAEWPSAMELAVAAERCDAGARSRIVAAVTALAHGDLRATRARAVGVLATVCAAEPRARALAVLGLADVVAGDARGAWLQLSAAVARSKHAGVRAAYELAARLAGAPTAPLALRRTPAFARELALHRAALSTFETHARRSPWHVEDVP